MAAAIHLGFLPLSVKNQAEFRAVLNNSIPFMTGCSKQDVGSLIYSGRGKKNEDVYIMAVGKKPTLILKTVTAMVTFFGEDLLNYRFVNCEEHLRKGEGKKGVRFIAGLSKYNLIGEMVAAVHKGL